MSELSHVDPPRFSALALEMLERAFEALAMLYELRHPGEYAAQAPQLREYVADHFRHIEQVLAKDAAGAEIFREAVLYIRGVFDRLDGEVTAMRPSSQGQPS